MRGGVFVRVFVFVFVFSNGVLGEEAADVELVRGPAPSLRAGRAGAVSLSIVPRAGAHLLAAGPVLVRVRAEGVRAPRPLYRRADAVDPRADVPRFEIAVEGTAAGAASIDAECTFYLCRGERCRPVVETARWQLSVEPESAR
jgi:hypothetical protein